MRNLTTTLFLTIFVISLASLSAYADDHHNDPNYDHLNDPNNPASGCYSERCDPYSEYQNPYSEYQNPYSEKYIPNCRLTGSC